MKITLAWLKTHLDTQASLDEIVALLIMRGLEVDSIENRAKHLAAFRVARVLKAEPHPNADKLRLCVVDAGAGEVQVVCGAPNARAGMTGVFAAPGVTIPRSGVVLKASAIRGVLSNGMLCSGWELGLTEDHEGIIELPEGLTPGQPFAEAMGLDDPVLDVKITANRADCLGVRGIARDLAAAGLGRLKPLAERWYEGGTDGTAANHPVPGLFPCPITVELAGPDDAACPLFLGRLVRGVRNGPSPPWLQARLEAIGLRPISALVDITNFMTFDNGRPLHVFDADKLKGNLTVRAARAGETLAALNGRSYTLDPDMTVIADERGALSLGGVIGGEGTGCTEATANVYIEAALFDPVRTAATGRRLNLQSDARYRFERGLDPAFVGPGLDMATRLILALCGGEASTVAQAGAVPDWQRRLRFRPDRVESLGGIDIPADAQRGTLEHLGCTVDQGNEWTVVPPSWRADIEGEADLVEEVLRIHGYEHIPAVPLTRETALPKPALDPAQRRAGFVRRTLAARGLVEAVTYSFLPTAEASLFGGGSDALRLANPISADLDAMRPSLLPNLLAAARRNADRGFADCALFEVGAQYRDDTPTGQDLVASGVRAGRTGAKRWDDPGRPVDAFLAKGDAMAALAALGVSAESLQAGGDPPAWFHPGQAGTLRLGPKVLARFGALHPALIAKFGLKDEAVAFEVFLDAVPLPRARGRARPLLVLSPFQPVERDFAFVVGADVAAETVLRAARGVDKKLVAEVRLFDVYTGPGVPDGKKSLAITIVLQPEEATLTDAALEGFSKRLVAAVEKATGGTLEELNPMVAFARIKKAALTRHGEKDLKSRMPKVKTPAALKKISDDRYFSDMSLRIFRAGLNHTVVDGKWPAFETAFAGFDPRRVRAMSEEQVEELMKDARLIRHLGKLRAVHANASSFLALAAEHGGMGQFLAAWPSTEITALWDTLAKRFAQMGGNSAPRFLRMVGKDTFVLTPAVIKALDHWGAFKGEPKTKSDRAAVQALFNDWAKETKMPLAHLSMTLATSVD